MKTSHAALTCQLKALEAERGQLAEVLQNDLNQTLAAVLLSIQFNQPSRGGANNLLLEAENNLKLVISKISTLHYSLVQDVN